MPKLLGYMCLGNLFSTSNSQVLNVVSQPKCESALVVNTSNMVDILICIVFMYLDIKIHNFATYIKLFAFI